jgi:uncharacterized caspase-like protein
MINRLLRIGKLSLLLLAFTISVASGQTNVALVIGNSAYQNAKVLSTTIADSSAMAETMRGAGYDVIALRDVRQAELGQVMRTFLDKVAAAGGDSVAFFYYAGYAAQSGGNNYLIPVDAPIAGASDVPSQSLRVGDLVEALAKTPAAARIIVLDASYNHGFGRGTAQAVPPGLDSMEAPAGMTIASAAAPREVAAEGTGTHSSYTRALVTLMRQRGVELDQIFKAARFQVSQSTGGKQTPWTSSALMVDITLFPAAAATPPPKAAAALPTAEPSKKKERRRQGERPRGERAVRAPAAPAQAGQAPRLPPATIGIGGISIGIGQ